MRSEEHDVTYFIAGQTGVVKCWSDVRGKATNHVKLVTLVILVRLVLV